MSRGQPEEPRIPLQKRIERIPMIGNMLMGANHLYNALTGANGVKNGFQYLSTEYMYSGHPNMKAGFRNQEKELQKALGNKLFYEIAAVIHGLYRL